MDGIDGRRADTSFGVDVKEWNGEDILLQALWDWGG